uniref:Ethylene-responsive transcription factor ERF106-like n=1 Tax=Populus alba TaxID=43335 RepID=A0A4U5QP11_POPAL|nr:ethylene-responsive transcription factor ERF106-like [Populus alba]
MATPEESSTLELIRKHLLGDFTSTDEFISNLESSIASVSVKLESSLSGSEPNSPISDQSYHSTQETYSFEIKPEIIDMTPPEPVFSGSSNQYPPPEPAGLSSPPPATGRKRGRSKRGEVLPESVDVSTENWNVKWSGEVEEGVSDEEQLSPLTQETMLARLS